MATSSYAGGAGIHLQTLVLDGSTTAEQKVNCLKLLKVVIKNLAAKPDEEKYRQLKLENEKVREKLLPCPSALEYLKALGFCETTVDGTRVLRVEHVNVAAMNASLTEVTNALDMVMPQTKSSTTTNKKPRTTSSPAKSTDLASMHKSTSTTKLSEKQKARILLEEKQQREKEEARKHRAEQVAKIKQDKFVRKHDENWKSGVSAAMAKTGDSISTFRDRHGEH